MGGSVQVAAFKDFSTEVSESAPAPAEVAAPAAAGGGASFPPHTLLEMPALSPTMSQGAWLFGFRVKPSGPANGLDSGGASIDAARAADRRHPSFRQHRL